MRKITFLLFIFSTLCFSQTTYTIDWENGVNGEDASLTIDVGDMVTWTWTNSASHTVTSLAGSQETFDSGTLTGVGQTFSYTFDEEGINNYQCDVHPGSMFGTITVVDNLKTEEYFVRNIKLYPNPATDVLNVFSLHQLSSYKIFNSLGQLVIQQNVSTQNLKLDLAAYTSGIYFIQLNSDENQKSFKFLVK